VRTRGCGSRRGSAGSCPGPSWPAIPYGIWSAPLEPGRDAGRGSQPGRRRRLLGASRVTGRSATRRQREVTGVAAQGPRTAGRERTYRAAWWYAAGRATPQAVPGHGSWPAKVTNGRWRRGQDVLPENRHGRRTTWSPGSTCGAGDRMLPGYGGMSGMGDGTQRGWGAETPASLRKHGLPARCEGLRGSRARSSGA